MYSGRKCKGSPLLKTGKYKGAYIRKNVSSPKPFLSALLSEKQQIKKKHYHQQKFRNIILNFCDKRNNCTNSDNLNSRPPLSLTNLMISSQNNFIPLSLEFLTQMFLFISNFKIL